MSNKVKLAIRYFIDLSVAVIAWIELMHSNLGTLFAVCICSMLTSYIIDDALRLYEDYKEGKDINIMPISLKFKFKASKK